MATVTALGNALQSCAVTEAEADSDSAVICLLDCDDDSLHAVLCWCTLSGLHMLACMQSRLRLLAQRTLTSATWRSRQPPTMLWEAGAFALEAPVYLGGHMAVRSVALGPTKAHRCAASMVRLGGEIALVVAISPSGEQVAATFDDGSIFVGDLPGQGQKQPVGVEASQEGAGHGSWSRLHDGHVAALAWIARHRFVTGGADSSIRQWQSPRGGEELECTAVSTLPGGEVTALACADGGPGGHNHTHNHAFSALLVSGDNAGMLRVWRCFEPRLAPSGSTLLERQRLSCTRGQSSGMLGSHTPPRAGLSVPSVHAVALTAVPPPDTPRATAAPATRAPPPVAVVAAVAGGVWVWADHTQPAQRAFLPSQGEVGALALRGITLVSVSAASGTLHVWSMARLVAAAAEAEAVREQRQGCDALLVARPLASLEPSGRAGAEQGGVPPTVCSVALSGDERCVVSGASDGSLQMFVLDS